MSYIAEWLDTLNLGQYSAAFTQNDIDFAILPHLTADDLIDIGITSVGHRRKLVEAIATLPEQDDRLSETPGPIVPASPKTVIEAERRQITIMFCDLVGSTALSQSLDPEDLRDVMRAYQDAVVDAVSKFGGHIAKYLGDGILAYFGWPQAYEDQADRAVRAGLNAIAAVAKLRLNNSQSLAARVGIATGQVVIGDLVGKSGHDSEAVSGETPNLAARLQSLAEKNQVVMDTNTRRLIGMAFKLEDLGKCNLKGFSEPVEAWHVVSEDVVESRFDVMRGSGTALAPLIGREHEMGLLLERWKLVKEGEGQVLELSGEAGIGKSRIVQTLIETIFDDPHFQLRYQCTPHHINSAYYPITNRLERAAGFVGGDDIDDRLDKLETLLHLSEKDLDATAPLFAALLSLQGEKRYGKLELTPQQLRERTSQALMDQLFGLARQRPVLFILEDSHWIDPTTREFIEQLAPTIVDTPVLILITHRQEQGRPFTALSHLTSITLNRLSRAQGKKIIEAVGGTAFPDEVMDQIVARGDGVPLYVEELTRSILESGRKVSTADIPESLQDSLMERLDRLNEDKELLQIGSVIGRDFGQDLLLAVMDCSEKELSGALDRIVRSELVVRHGLSPDVIFTFRHALVQDVAYQSLLKRTRQDFHRKVAKLLKSRFPETDQTQPELLAHHYIKAGLPERSIPYWYKAGQRAIDRSANLEAISHLAKGREILSGQPNSAEKDAQELDFCLALGPAIMSIKGLAAPEAKEVYLRARQLCKSVKQPSLAFQSAWGLWLVYQQRGQINFAQSVSDEVLSLAEQESENVDHLLQAHHAAWTTQLFVGNFSESREHAEQGNALYDIEKHRNHAFTYGGHDPGVCAKTSASEALCLLGFVDQAVQIASDGISLAEKLSHPFSLAMAHYFIAQVHQNRLEAEIARVQAQATITLCESHGFESFRAQAAVLLGWATAASGEYDSGIAQIREGLTAWQSTGTGMRRPYFLALLADALLRANQTQEGLNVITEAEDLIESSGETRWQAETVRLRGVLMDRAGADKEEVEATYQSAMEIAHRQEARWLQLRAATSLGRLWYDQGKLVEARELLGPIYTCFTEGFDTLDLRNLKALLTELS